MRSELFSAENLEKESAQPGLRLQNSKLLKAELNGDFMARQADEVLPGALRASASPCWILFRELRPLREDASAGAHPTPYGWPPPRGTPAGRERSAPPSGAP